MNLATLEARWLAVSKTDKALYNSLRIDAECLPDIYVALDMEGRRSLILKVPNGIEVRCKDVDMENLSLRWHLEKRYIVIGLQNDAFRDLFNDLVLSLYNRVRDIENPVKYKDEFISVFNKWAEFFNDLTTSLLSEELLKGIFGELICLRYYLQLFPPTDANFILSAWRGPYGRTQDFIFNDYNVEVKTKEYNQVKIHISSEFQLTPELGKKLNLGVVNLQRDINGMSIEELVLEIKNLISANSGDLTILHKGFGALGIRNKLELYDDYRWIPKDIILYDCNENSDFPRLTEGNVPKMISCVKYDINLTLLDKFIIQRIEL